MNFIAYGFGASTLFWALAGLAGQVSPAVAIDAGSSPAVTVVKFELLDRHLIVLRGSIGRLEGLKLLIDTGSIPSVVDQRIAKKLTLQLEESAFVAFGQKSRTHRAVLPNIRIGPLHVDDVTVGVGDLSYLHGVDAVIGLDVLYHSSFSVDYEGRRLLFGPLVARQPSVKLEVTPPFLTVQLSLNGHPIRLLVDSGSGRLVLFERRVHDRLPPPALHGELVMYHGSGTSRLNRVFLPPLGVGGQNLEHVEAFISDASMEGYPAGIDGVLGLWVLASKRADFDFERNRLAF